jgi:hypothetical protein
MPRSKLVRLTCVVLFKTANLFLATKMADCPLPFLPSTEESFTSPCACVGRFVNSNSPLSDEIVRMTACSAGLKLRPQGPLRYVWASELAYAQQTNIGASVEVVCADIFVPSIIERILMDSKRRSLPFQFEDNQTTIVSCCIGFSQWLRCVKEIAPAAKRFS